MTGGTPPQGPYDSQPAGNPPRHGQPAPGSQYGAPGQQPYGAPAQPPRPQQPYGAPQPYGNPPRPYGAPPQAPPAGQYSPGQQAPPQYPAPHQPGPPQPGPHQQAPQPHYGAAPQHASAPQPGGALGPQGLLLTTKFFPLAWILYFIKPKVEIDGQQIPAVWGDNTIPLPPGQHHLHVHVPYILPPKIGPADATVNVAPGQTVGMEYRAPAWTFSKGSLGEGPQQYNGVGLMIGMMVVPIVVIVVLFIALALLGP
ncbi:hypothetical protein [Gordonia sp. (in: high G+C Gram-positive bacteria)]|uniref:hypothetical protein n=1 Tax=Gordonia sp. (in: high G+C Gram-positive bacteria) TaxID=84139 RepID=UPI00352868EC